MNKSVSHSAAPHRAEDGFAVFKLLFWLAVAGFVLLNAAVIAQAYYNNSKVQGCFDSLSSNMPAANASEIRLRLDALFRVQYIAADDFPQEFYEELFINATGHGFEISSYYEVTIWPFGHLEGVDEQSEYLPDDLTGMDVLRHKARIDLIFEPYAISPMALQ